MNQKVSRLAKDHVFVDMFNQKKILFRVVQRPSS